MFSAIDREIVWRFLRKSTQLSFRFGIKGRYLPEQPEVLGRSTSKSLYCNMTDAFMIVIYDHDKRNWHIISITNLQRDLKSYLNITINDCDVRTIEKELGGIFGFGVDHDELIDYDW